jgi:prepilin-type processing-associated H-X9-DG protein
MMYGQQYGYFPSMTFMPGGGGIDGGAYCWPVHLRKILDGNQKVFYCPAQDPKCEWTRDAPGAVLLAQLTETKYGYERGERLILSGWYNTTTPIGTGTFFSYGINHMGYGENAPRGTGTFLFGMGFPTRAIKMTSVRSPSQFIVLADSAADGANDPEIAPTRVLLNGLVNLGIGAPHRGGANILFCDGHVQWYLKKDVIISDGDPVPAEEPTQRMWNADNLPYRRP